MRLTSDAATRYPDRFVINSPLIGKRLNGSTTDR